MKENPSKLGGIFKNKGNPEKTKKSVAIGGSKEFDRDTSAPSIKFEDDNANLISKDDDDSNLKSPKGYH